MPWAWAFDTPYKWTKQIPSFFGGTGNGMAISWPARIKDNHRTFLRSHRPERVGKSPKELMTGQSHPHWLELLGFTRFQLP